MCLRAERHDEAHRALVALVRRVDPDSQGMGLADAHYSGGDAAELLHGIGWDCVWEHPQRTGESMWEHPATGDQVHVVAGSDLFARPALSNDRVAATDPQAEPWDWRASLTTLVDNLPRPGVTEALDVVATALSRNAPTALNDGRRLRCPYTMCGSPHIAEYDYSTRVNHIVDLDEHGTLSIDADHTQCAYETVTFYCRSCNQPVSLPDSCTPEYD